MTTATRILAVRRAPAIIGCTVVLSALSWRFGAVAVPLRLNALSRPYRVPVVEMVVLVLAILVAYLARPRLWQHERLGGPRTGAIAAGCALTGTALALLPVLACVVALPPGFRWSWLAANATLLAAAVHMMAALCGPLVGGGVIAALYACTAVLRNVAPDGAGFVPLSAYSAGVLPGGGIAPEAHWTTALLLAAAAALVHWHTRGSTEWTQRRAGAEN